MKLAALSTTLLATLSLVSWSAHAADATAGKTKAAVCGACHGPDGNSANPIWPKLAGQNAAYIEKQVIAIRARDGRSNPQAETMRPLVANLSASDLADIAAFYAAQTSSAEAAPADSVKVGQALYRGGDAEAGIPACMSCHGPAGEGLASAGYPRVGGQHAQYTAGQLKAFREGSRSTDANQMMRVVAAKLSDAQIQALAGYLSGLH
jgi:cytochrome c553